MPIFLAIGFIGFVGMSILIVFIAYFERSLIDPYVEIDIERPSPGSPPLAHFSRYTEHMVDGAMAAGFVFGSMVAHRKYPMYQIAGVVALSQDRRTLMVTGSGKAGNLTGHQTWLYTPRRDGTWIVTTDQPGTLSTEFESLERVVNGPWSEVLAVHLGRINADERVMPFLPGRPFDLLAQQARSKAERIVQSGRGRYRDAGMQTWSFSLLSSFGVIGGFCKQIRAAFAQQERTIRKPVASPELDVPAAPLVARWKRARVSKPADLDLHPGR